MFVSSLFCFFFFLVCFVFWVCLFVGAGVCVPVCCGRSILIIMEPLPEKLQFLDIDCNHQTHSQENVQKKMVSQGVACGHAGMKCSQLKISKCC